MASKAKTKRIDHPRTQNDYRRGARSFGEMPELLFEATQSTQEYVDGSQQFQVQQVVVGWRWPEPLPERLPAPPERILSQTEGVRQLNRTAPTTSHQIDDERAHLHERLVNRLTESVCADYRICRMRHVPWGRKPVMFAYNQSLQRFAELAAQMRRFPQRFVGALLEFRDAENCTYEDRTALADARIREILTRIKVPPFVPHPKRLTADYFTALDPRELLFELRQSLVEDTRSEIRQFMGLLYSMQQTGIVGQITSSDPAGSSFYFHRFPMIFSAEPWPDSESEYSTETVKTERPYTNPHALGRQLEIRTQQIKQTQHVLQHREAKHEVELLNPRRSTLWSDRLKGAPDYVQNVVRSVPDALVPHLDILSGIQVGGRVFERDIDTEPWRRRRVTEETVEVIHLDPGILLGPFLLVGYHGDCRQSLIDYRRVGRRLGQLTRSCLRRAQK